MVKKIPIEKLIPGMYIEKLDLSWMEHPFFFSKRGKVKSAEDVEELRSQGIETLYIDVSKGVDVKKDPPPRPTPVHRPAPPPPDVSPRETGPARTPSLAEEMSSARRIYTEMISFAKDLIHEARTGKAVPYEQAMPLVDAVIDSVTRNANALTALTNLRSYDEYTYTHSMNVSVLAVVFGRYLGFSRDQLRILSIGGMFHDIGKVRVPDAILNKPGRLTEEEFEAMKNHPLFGFAMMETQPGIPPDVLRIILEHHEKFNGRGYPRGMRGDEISTFGNLISVVDVYDALTTDRVYRQAIHPNKALTILFRGKEEDFRPDLAERFVKCIGIFPVGSLVKMESGDYAVVVETKADQPLFPKVCLVLDHKLRPRIPEIIDLAGGQPQDPRQPRIAECLEPREVKLDLTPIFLKALKRL